MGCRFDEIDRLVSGEIEHAQRRRFRSMHDVCNPLFEELNLVGEGHTGVQNLFQVLFNIMCSLIH